MPKIIRGQFSILLIKPMKDKTYVRKVTNFAFSQFKALCIVNKKNVVTQVATEAMHDLVSPQNLDKYLQDVLGKKRVEKLKPTDGVRFWAVKETVPLTPPYELSSPVRGIRYATPEEELDIEKIIVKSWFNAFNLTYEDVFWGTHEYPKVYASSIQFDFQNALFELEQTGELYEFKKSKKNIISNYKPIGNSGQTKLM